MQRYRPDIAFPISGDPSPIMAEDSQEGQYYHKDDVERLLRCLQGIASCGTCGVCRGAAESVLVHPEAPQSSQE